LGLRTDACRGLLDAWLGWRRGNLLPTRAAIDPGDLKPILPLIGLLEVSARDVATFRLAGSQLRDVFGFDPTGRNVVDLVRNQFRVQRAYRLYLPATQPCGYLGQNKFTYSAGIPDTFESIGLPVASDSAGGAPLVIFTLDSILGRRWKKETGSIIDMTTDRFQFLDIGAGLPASIDPPPGFLENR